MAAVEGDADAATTLVAHPLGTAYLDGLLELSRAAHWNQDADDWRHLLSSGPGWGLSTADGTVVASTVVLPYRRPAGPDPGFAWISMVLVRPGHQRRGHASRLLREALAWLDAEGLTPVLDATPAGHPVYRREGFVDTWGFARLERASPPAEAPAPGALPPGVRIEPLAAAHWPGVLALDAPAFGASREPLLRALAARLPAAAHVALRGDAVAGYLLGRPGRVAAQLGPLACADAASAVALLDAGLRACAGRVFVDLPDARTDLAAALRARGFAPQRPFTRLVRPRVAGAPVAAPGDATAIGLVAGPELG